MIFVTLGTHELQFNRLLSYVEKTFIDEEVIIQSGNTEFQSGKYKVRPFLEAKDFNECIEKCNLVICHGGVGTILSALRKDKKVIVVPRLYIYNEHNDDHQLEISNKLDKQGYIITCQNYTEFNEAIKNYKSKELKKYKFNNEKIIKFIKTYIDEI